MAARLAACHTTHPRPYAYPDAGSSFHTLSQPFWKDVKRASSDSDRSVPMTCRHVSVDPKRTSGSLPAKRWSLATVAGPTGALPIKKSTFRKPVCSSPSGAGNLFVAAKFSKKSCEQSDTANNIGELVSFIGSKYVHKNCQAPVFVLCVHMRYSYKMERHSRSHDPVVLAPAASKISQHFPV
jgi:hypothetical protein